MNKISAVEKGAINKQRYSDYVSGLETEGRKFPINQFGDLNLTEIASACGFNRQVFSTNKSMKQQLISDAKRIGTELTDGKKQDDVLAKKAKASSEQVNKLMRDLSVAEEKISALQQQVMQLEVENKRLKNDKNEATASLEFMFETGRRFTL
ncbi:MAG TPA: hypothetical protein DCR64_06115 [Vibrio sp.]|nr:hypothetical protein [Vibrio sp.]